MMKETSDRIVDMLMEIVLELKEYVGKGEEYKEYVDFISTKKYDKIMEIIPIKDVLSFEGERDGIFASELQKIFWNKKEKKEGYVISADPIDGTSACVRGGSRVCSAFAIWDISKREYKKVPDNLSCFCVASNKSEDFLCNLWVENGRIGQFAKNNNYQEYVLSTLHRSESDEMWDNILNSRVVQNTVGEDCFYLPNKMTNNIFMAGDSSLTLPWESECFIGRVGSSEARIESAIWKYWKGILVSGKRMKQYPGGEIQYLIDRINLAQKGEGVIDYFFTKEELDTLHMFGWTKDEITGFLDKNDFTPPVKYIWIVSITGTKDRKFNMHSINNLSPIKTRDDEVVVEYLEIMDCDCIKLKIWKQETGVLSS